jgi:non-heme chloroperoxidase
MHHIKLIKIITIGLPLWAALFLQDATAQTSLKKVRVNGTELHYVERGKGVAVIFVHGGLEDYRVWQPQMREFSERYHTVAYSRRYNYPNNRVVPRADYSAIVDADDLATLIKKLNLGPAHIVGVSYGAYVALFLAARHPELVRSLVLSEPPLMRLLSELEGGKAIFDEFMSTVWEPATRGFLVGPEAGVKAAVDGFGELGYSGSDTKMTFEALSPMVRDPLMENALEWKALTISQDPFPDLPRSAIAHIKVPTLLLSGQRSLTLHGLIDTQLEKLLPLRERIIISNATHEMWNEYPEGCRNATLVFIGKH